MRRVLPWLLPLALALHLAVVAVWTTGLTALYDLEVYRAGGSALLHGGSLYDGYVFWVLYFTYPPFAAAAFTPLALLPAGLLKLLFTAVNVAALGTVIWLSLRALGRQHRRNLTLGLTGALFWLEPVRSTIDIGQINLLLMLLVLADLLRPSGARYYGAGVGIAAGIKLVPGVFVLYLLLTRRYRAALVAGAAFLTTVALGFLVAPRDSARYWTGTFLTTGRIGNTAAPGNQSLAGLLARLGAPGPLWVLVALAAGTGGMAVAVLAHRRGHRLLGLAICGLTSCAVSPFAWNHHWVWFVPLLVLLFTRVNRLPAVVLYLLLLDWPVSLPARDWIFPPPTGLIALATPGPLTRNLYVLIAVVVVAYAARWLRSDPAGRPAPAGDLGEHDTGGDRGVERVDPGGHRDRDGLVADLLDQPGQSATLRADHDDQG
jgi:alpha-1,2-mannosyltransferase